MNETKSAYAAHHGNPKPHGSESDVSEWEAETEKVKHERQPSKDYKKGHSRSNTKDTTKSHRRDISKDSNNYELEYSENLTRNFSRHRPKHAPREYTVDYMKYPIADPLRDYSRHPVHDPMRDHTRHFENDPTRERMTRYEPDLERGHTNRSRRTEMERQSSVISGVSGNTRNTRNSGRKSNLNEPRLPLTLANSDYLKAFKRGGSTKRKTRVISGQRVDVEDEDGDALTALPQFYAPGEFRRAQASLFAGVRTRDSISITESDMRSELSSLGSDFNKVSGMKIDPDKGRDMYIVDFIENDPLVSGSTSKFRLRSGPNRL